MKFFNCKMDSWNYSIKSIKQYISGLFGGLAIFLWLNHMNEHIAIYSFARNGRFFEGMFSDSESTVRHFRSRKDFFWGIGNSSRRTILGTT